MNVNRAPQAGPSICVCGAVAHRRGRSGGVYAELGVFVLAEPSQRGWLLPRFAAETPGITVNRMAI